MDALLDAAAVGKALGDISARHVLELRDRYDWPHVRVGRRYRWTAEQVEEIVRKHTVIPAEKPNEDLPKVVAIDGLTARSARRGKASP